jgi:predicted restriction endonuclease
MHNKPHTQEAKDKMRLSHLGKPSGRLGKKHSIEARIKMSEANKGKVAWNKGKKLGSSWNKGMSLSEEQKKHISDTLKRKGIEPKVKFIGIKENNPAWKGGTQLQAEMDRVKFKNTVQKMVLKRDDYTCQICGVRGTTMHVDHIVDFANSVKLRFEVDNCRTLCVKCHYEITFKRPMPINSNWGFIFK